MTPRPEIEDRELTRTAFAILAVLALINLLNYLDRYVLSAVLPEVVDSFRLSDRQSGLLGSVFMLVHLAASPFAGYLGDRRRRKYLVAAGVFIWSAATIGSGLATNYSTLLVMRALVGFGEAGYATVAPGMIADLFSEQRRGRMLAFFYMAIPVGTALGYVIGGAAAERYGWQWAFYIAGAPGLLATIAALVIPEPKRGATEVRPEGAIQRTARQSWERVARSPVWWYNTMGTAMITFTVGGLAFWMPSFLARQHGTTGGSMGIQLGVVLLAAGLLSTPLGGYLGDRATRRHPGGHLKISAIALTCSLPLVAALPFLSSLGATLGVAFATLFLLGLTIGPINAALVSCVPPSVRSTAVALNLILVHLLGDALSPWLIGWVSDATNLRLAIALTALPVGIGAAILAYGARQVMHRGEGLKYVA